MERKSPSSKKFSLNITNAIVEVKGKNEEKAKSGVGNVG